MTDEQMAGLTDFLDEFFNGVDCSPEDRRTGFLLLTFPMRPDDEHHGVGQWTNVEGLEIEFEATRG